jgi:hypothetical protein
VAQQVSHSPAGGPRQSQLLLSVADHAFTHAVAHTSLIGGIILAVGTVVVALVLPGRKADHDLHAATSQEAVLVQETASSH